jgi:hypothetical protein
MNSADVLCHALQEDGIVILPEFVTGAQLEGMQYAFSGALDRLRASSTDGYEKTEFLRDMVERPLLLDQGFLDLGLHPTIVDLARRYVGPQFQLTECKGWRSRVTRKDWHGWHGDSWYDQQIIRDSIPREVKVGLYLTDVDTGGLAYIKGSHRRLRPRLHSRKEGSEFLRGERVDVRGPAGTTFVFDTSGIHRQSHPILQTRHALFYCYHDPAVPLQAEDVGHNRYAPLHLNAAFLGNLTQEQRRILGFGDKRNYARGFQRSTCPRLAHAVFSGLLESELWIEEYFEPILRRMRAVRTRLSPKTLTAADGRERKHA